VPLKAFITKAKGWLPKTSITPSAAMGWIKSSTGSPHIDECWFFRCNNILHGFNKKEEISQNKIEK